MRIYHPYTEWEDYQNGMYHETVTDDMIKKSAYILSNECLFYETCLQILKKWPKACENHLSNKGQNRRAWLGRAASSFWGGATEKATRIAWNNLDQKTQNRANLVAYKIIKIYEARSREIRETMGAEVLF